MANSDPGALPIEPRRPSVADQIFDDMQRRILTLDLPPNTKVSEIEIARQANVSRQPVRDAFYRLSEQGFLNIRPQRATLVTQISARAIRESRFVRTALELETSRIACETFGHEDIAALDWIIEQQEEATVQDDPDRFHELDDALHAAICNRGGQGFAWKLIQLQKAHTDRVRYLSLAFAAKEAIDDHKAIVDGIRHHDIDACHAAVRRHLGRIQGQIAQIRAQHSAYFEPEDTP
ncbi:MULTISPECIES: GntR family transcriptional regulator [unclassified Meridianimarinicoccus]|uniref:GntR family transcriptional regulator n=1 Tax=unclassified Meridianimarinicoccus TaxID=2923344 RepID=UPI0018674951|nr:GntR family transcriptional regulator [Fluviibacterium sp. MJW13]